LGALSPASLTPLHAKVFRPGSHFRPGVIVLTGCPARFRTRTSTVAGAERPKVIRARHSP